MFNVSIQDLILLICGFTCLLICLFGSIIRYSSKQRKHSLLIMELSTAVLLISDFFSYHYQGLSTKNAFLVSRISNFLLYFILYVELSGITSYIRSFLAEKNVRTLKRLLVINIISLIGMILIIISQFKGLIYYFDENNVYYRGPLFVFSFIAPVTIYLIITWTIIQFRKSFPKITFVSLILFSTLPVLFSVIQVFHYGLSLMNLSIGICAIILFGCSLIDQNLYLRHIATHDAMTNLYNSGGFMMEIGKLKHLGKIENYNAFYFDISRLGLINRNYGTDTGNHLVINYANSLKASMEKDEVLGRLGGSFFVALLKKRNTESFIKKLSGFDVMVETQNGEEIFNVKAVAGIYQIEDNTVLPQNIMNNIAMAVNLAKNIRHVPYIFMTQELIKEMNDIKILQEMIPEFIKNREFKPYYQPKVDITTNTLCGAEALVRLEHDGRVIPPDYFIRSMEQNSSICKLDFYILNYVCEDLRKWLDEGLNPPVISINFSRRNLGNPILAEEIYNVIKSHNIPVELIQIEVTETIDEFPLSYLKGVVEALKRYGISTAIDDFGTGSSSIHMIKEVPFNELKIDKSFIDNISEKDCKILSYIIAMAKDLGATVITEGVETKEQLEVLRKLECTRIQGYYFDQPLKKAKFEKRLKDPFYKPKA